jgi:hypothetical protein
MNATGWIAVARAANPKSDTSLQTVGLSRTGGACIWSYAYDYG